RLSAPGAARQDAPRSGAARARGRGDPRAGEEARAPRAPDPRGAARQVARLSLSRFIRSAFERLGPGRPSAARERAGGRLVVGDGPRRRVVLETRANRQANRRSAWRRIVELAIAGACSAAGCVTSCAKATRDSCSLNSDSVEGSYCAPEKLCTQDCVDATRD